MLITSLDYWRMCLDSNIGSDKFFLLRPHWRWAFKNIPLPNRSYTPVSGGLNLQIDTKLALIGTSHASEEWSLFLRLLHPSSHTSHWSNSVVIGLLGKSILALALQKWLWTGHSWVSQLICLNLVSSAHKNK